VRSLELAIKFLAGERMIGTAAERAALTVPIQTGTPFYETDFSSSTGWNFDNANGNITISSNKANLAGEVEGDQITYALSEALSDVAWFIKYKFNKIATQSGGQADELVFLAIQDSITNIKTVGKAIGGWTSTAPVALKYSGGTRTRGTVDGGLGFSYNTDYWVELSRDVNTVTLKRYSSDAFSGTPDISSVTVDSSFTGLDTIFIGYEDNGATWGQNGYITDLEIYNGVTYPNLSNGTIFEESDTGKHYMFDGTSTWNEIT